MTAREQHRMWVWGNIVVIGAGILLLVMWLPQGIHKTISSKPAPQATTPAIYFVQAAALPSGFPAYLILEPKATFFIATSTNNGIRAGIVMVRWNSGTPAGPLADLYKSYFAKKGWTFADRAMTDPTIKAISLSAKSANVTNESILNNTSSVSSAVSADFIIAPRSGGSSVTITYFGPNKK